jgi:hypothetical protein
LLIAFLFFPFFDFYFGSAVATLQDMIAGSVQKCLVPILTTIVNFGTIQELLAKYWELVLSKIRSAFYES